MDLIVLLIVPIIGFLVLFFYLKNNLKSSSQSDQVLSQWLNTVQTSLDSSTRMMADLQRSLGEMSEVGRGIKSLQDFLASPKLRGGMGEEILSQMIGETFPKNAFHLQYRFKIGTIVDAVLKTEAGLLCIDSKFPTQNYTTADVKKHVGDIKTKYILPAEGTLDFALMYIPSESIYYEVVNNRELIRVFREARVYPVSPNTLYAHLQVLLQSLQGKELEKKSREILKSMQALQKDYSHLEDNLGTLSRHLTNAYNQMSQVNSSFNSLGQKLTHTHSLSPPDT